LGSAFEYTWGIFFIPEQVKIYYYQGVNMKILFVGAVEGSLIALKALADSGIHPTHVLTLPPDSASRHSDFVDITDFARRIGSEVIYSKEINDDETLLKLEMIRPDLCLVIGWSQICHARFRKIARLGNIGFHPAPLPKLRGRAVIPWTIILNQPTTAASLFWLDEGVDSGDILAQSAITVTADETALSLYKKQTDALAEMLPVAVASVRDGTAKRVPQDHSKASYCAKRTPEDGRIDWSDTAANIERFIRAVGAPYPGAFTTNNEDRVWIDKARLPHTPTEYIGIPGQIQSIAKDSFTVLCGDYQCVEVLEWRHSGSGRLRQHSVFRPEMSR
jgi:methionyl-tRNA formyltransferase